MQSMDVFTIKLDNSRIVSNSLLVLAKLSIAISSVVESLNIVSRAKLDLIPIVLYGSLKSLQFTINQSSVTVNYRVLRV
jgi:hypothetical protein